MSDSQGSRFDPEQWIPNWIDKLGKDQVREIAERGTIREALRVIQQMLDFLDDGQPIAAANYGFIYLESQRSLLR